MFNVLIVDDEPLICKGLSSLLMDSGLTIHTVFIAYNGYEALDYLRMEDIDLLVTDIQMGSMSGMELMQQARIIKPWVQTIVISAHEDFHYAQLSIRLGAKDYLIKPLNSAHFLDTVRNVLLKMEKLVPTRDEYIAQLNEHFVMIEPNLESTTLLNEITSYKLDPIEITNKLQRLSTDYGIKLVGPHYAVVKIRLNISQNELKERTSSTLNVELFNYAALNIVCESLGAATNHVSFYSPHHEISVILQWSDEEFADSKINKIVQLELIGRSFHHNIQKHLQIECLVGISQVLKGVEFIFDLSRQAEKAISWNQEHLDNHVFYYGDFNWNSYLEEPTVEDIHSQNNTIVNHAMAYIQEHYNQKGLTLNEVAQRNHVSPNYLSYLFKKFTGYNLWEFVIKLRMEESKRLLLNSDLRRYEIAEQVGYESPEHFSKIFKKYFGISLSEMKK